MLTRLHIVVLASVLAAGIAGAYAEDDPAAQKAQGGNAAELPAPIPDAAGVSGPVVATPDQRVPSAPDTSGKPSDAAAQDRGAPTTAATPQAAPSTPNAADEEAAVEAPKLNLTKALQRRIARSLGGGKNTAPTTGEDGITSDVSVGNALPAPVTLRDFPAELVELAAGLKDVKYVLLPDRILVVNPSNRVVMADIAL